MHDETIYDICVIGAGASGMMAALAGAMSGAKVCLLEAKDRVGTKILKTGNGRCNLSHSPISGDEYAGTGATYLSGYLDRFGVSDTLDFFKHIGLFTREKDGYIYPYSENASAVLDVLRFSVRDYGVRVYTGHYVKSIEKDGKGFSVICNVRDDADDKDKRPGSGRDRKIPESAKVSQQIMTARNVILSTGGAADPSSGSDGNGFKLARKLGLHVIKPLPSLVKVIADDKDMAILSGVRAKGKVWIIPDDPISIDMICDMGEIQFTKDGLSGIPVFNISRHVSVMLDKGLEVVLSVDLMPDMEDSEIKKHLVSLSENDRSDMSIEELMSGVINKKIASYIFKKTGVNPNTQVSEIPDKKTDIIIRLLKDMRFNISTTYGFDQAQVTCGGVDFSEVGDDLQCIRIPGLYLTGELLDIDGRCGGYNLQWAWTSGYIAGHHAAEKT